MALNDEQKEALKIEQTRISDYQKWNTINHLKKIALLLAFIGLLIKLIIDFSNSLGYDTIKTGIIKFLIILVVFFICCWIYFWIVRKSHWHNGDLVRMQIELEHAVFEGSVKELIDHRKKEWEKDYQKKVGKGLLRTILDEITFK